MQQVTTLLILLTIFYSAQSAAVCGPNEEYKECASACAPTPTCADISNQPKIIKIQPDIACVDVCAQGCYCISGYVRNPRDGGCVVPIRCDGTNIWDGQDQAEIDLQDA